MNELARMLGGRDLTNVTLAHARAMLASGETAYAALKSRYKAGITPYIDLLTAETALIEQRRAVADLEAGAFAYDVALVRALGGGYAVKN